jgi:hypothetical protein
MIKRIFIGIVIVLIIIQFIRPSKNISGEISMDISTLYEVPTDVNTILQRACNDCHSNKTIYPWYAEVQPIGWWLNNHVVDGKRHLNLNNFTTLKVAVQKKRMEELMDQIRHDEMPLSSYTLIHRNAKLSKMDKETMYKWSQKIIDTLKAKYPADSLILKKEKWHE